MRIAILFSGSALSGFVGGFLAYAISYTDGVLAGWQWLFIIEGIPPTIVGVLTYFFLPSYPEETKWLSQEERDAIVEHLHKDAPKKSGKSWDKKAAVLLFCDPTFWTFIFAWICVGVGSHGIGVSLPSVIHSLGFTTSKMSNVLTIPPAFAYFSLALLLGWWLQKGWIDPFKAALTLDIIVIVCYVVLLNIDAVKARYVILIIATASGSVLFPILWPSRVQAVRGTAMSGLAIGIHNASAQFTGILGPQVYSSVYAPTYHVSYKVSIALMSAAFVFHSLTWYFMHGPIQKYTPYLAKHVQAQTQIRKGDLVDNTSERVGQV